MPSSKRPSIGYLIDPRFPGGTASAFAQELRAISEMDLSVTVYAISSQMFRNHPQNKILMDVIEDLRIEFVQDPIFVSKDVVVLHNPSFLKFDFMIKANILTYHLIVVTHENFLRPGGFLAFDVASCLKLLDRSAVALRKSLAPVSAYNRSTVEAWLSSNPSFAHWTVRERDWFNICEFSYVEPAANPVDRRGRHSRSGYEKFPRLEWMDRCFPTHAHKNLILGADTFIRAQINRPHWTMVPFQGMNLKEFFDAIDFHVYFTAPTWRESFGRVLAEAIAAGKLVISDAETGSVLSGGIVTAAPDDVDAVITHHLSHPSEYQRRVRNGQESLRAFSAERFRECLIEIVE